MVKVLFFNKLSRTYWVGIVPRPNIKDMLRSMNRYRCGTHYVIVGADSVATALHLIPKDWYHYKGDIDKALLQPRARGKKSLG